MAKKSVKNNYCVYVHINKTNGKMYVGQSCDLKERWRSQGKNYFNSIKFFNALQKYGWDNFLHEVIIDNLYIEDADRIETELIETFDTIRNGYNLKAGGARGELSPESLKKMGDSVRRGFQEHPERVEKIRKAKLGTKMSEESKVKMSQSSARAILITVNGVTGCIRFWAKTTVIDHSTLVNRKRKYGMENLINYISRKFCA